MKLVLSSAGLREEFKEEFLQLLGKDPKDCKVAFIPTAADPEQDKGFVKWSTDQIEAAGMNWYEVDLKNENKSSLLDKLSPADIIWVNGGNTFYLLDQAKRSGFAEMIKDLLESGKIYYGVSAGSYLACPTIEAAKWKHTSDPDIVGKKDLSALHLVDFLLIAHYGEKYKDDVKNGAATTNYPVVALSDSHAVLIDGATIKIVGSGESPMFNGFENLPN